MEKFVNKVCIPCSSIPLWDFNDKDCPPDGGDGRLMVTASVCPESTIHAQPAMIS